jgi:hypothetical protein
MPSTRRVHVGVPTTIPRIDDPETKEFRGRHTTTAERRRGRPPLPADLSRRPAGREGRPADILVEVD